jgi:hypothetical protein
MPASATAGLRAALAAWIWPMRPAPMTAILIAMLFAPLLLTV